MSIAMCCCCRAYILDKPRHRVTIDKVDDKGQVGDQVRIYRNVCDDCMGEINETMDELGCEEDSEKQEIVFPIMKCAFCKSVDFHRHCCNCRFILCNNHAHQTENNGQYRCPTCEWTNRVPYVHLTTPTPTIAEIESKRK